MRWPARLSATLDDELTIHYTRFGVTNGARGRDSLDELQRERLPAAGLGSSVFDRPVSP